MLEVFDTEKRNCLDIDEIRSIVKDNADKFDEAETQEFIRDANVSGSGTIYYEDFVESIFRSSPDLYELKANYLYEDPNEDPSVPKEPVIGEITTIDANYPQPDQTKTRAAKAEKKKKPKKKK